MQEDLDLHAGFHSGVDWAKQTAEWVHLERLSKICPTDLPGDGAGDWLWSEIMAPGESRSGSVPREELDACYGLSENAHDASHLFLAGFIEGAEAVFANVKEQII